MVDVLTSFPISPIPPPPSSSSSPKSNMPMLYYGLVVVGTAAIVLAIYNIFIIKWCSRSQMQSQASGSNQMAVEVATGRSFESSKRNLLSSFKYKKEQEQGGDGAAAGDYECPVCLSVFEEGEQVTKLPRCNHSFHALCIDMWLYSHFDCPICRTPVGPFGGRRFLPESQSPAENSREGLMESGGVS
ncbi:hypothetical protein L6164_013907 [Bauhinia variegata]|uniref:Uncharacterized protein n=1 Tax=Bauhinia variegata TaxID=167791 RepID=A0ACB9NFU8_BAUVA|nr:hypothetical protein L6164_013907 [Bauhinia variegata]